MSIQDGRQGYLTRILPRVGHPTNVVDLGLIRALNERCLDLLVQLAVSEHASVPTAISSNRDLWRVFDASVRERAARHPVLLMDINFADSAWWRCVADGRLVEERSSVTGSLPFGMAGELMRETVTLAWIIARADEGLATILCGMAPPVARIFSSFSSPDVERLSARHHGHLRLRFDDHPSYWRMYLKIAGCKSSTASLSLDTFVESCQ